MMPEVKKALSKWHRQKEQLEKLQREAQKAATKEEAKQRRQAEEERRKKEKKEKKAWETKQRAEEQYLKKHKIPDILNGIKNIVWRDYKGIDSGINKSPYEPNTPYKPAYAMLYWFNIGKDRITVTSIEGIACYPARDSNDHFIGVEITGIPEAIKLEEPQTSQAKKRNKHKLNGGLHYAFHHPVPFRQVKG